MSALSPGLVKGQVPTSDQWNSYFAGKLDNVFASLPVAEAGTDTTLPINAAGLAAAIVSQLTSLPTSLPATSGQLWWNGGVLCKS